MIGIDAYTLDRPFANMVADYRHTCDGRYIWPAHFAGITREYCQIEKLANLHLLPRPHGAVPTRSPEPFSAKPSKTR